MYPFDHCRPLRVAGFMALGLVALTGTSRAADDVPPSMVHSPTLRLAAARDSLPAPPVDSLIARAFRNSPDLVALHDRIDSAREASDASGGLKSLRIGLMFSDAGFPDWTVGEEEMSMIGPEFELTLPFPGGGSARREALEGETGVRKAELLAAERQMVFGIREAYAAIYAVDRELSAHRTVHEMLAALEENQRGRIATGTSSAATLGAALRIEQLDDTCDDLERSRLTAMETIRRLMGDPAYPDLPSIRSLDASPTPAAGAESLAVAGSPFVLLARAELESFTRQADLARAKRLPDLVVGGAWGFRGGLEIQNPDGSTTHGDVAQFRVGIELPFLAGLESGPELAGSEANLLAARSRLTAAETSARAQARRLLAARAVSEAQRRRYDDVIIPLAHSTFESTRSDLLSGRTAFSDLLESFSMWIDAEAGLARRTSELYLLDAEIERLTGGTR